MTVSLWAFITKQRSQDVDDNALQEFEFICITSTPKKLE
jgi:hypothetical protein